ncbi:MAG: hypothetical protein ACE15C_05655 [Phycisphaerae bacterium]
MPIGKRLAELLGMSYGIEFDLDRPFWSLDGATTFPAIFRALRNLLPEGSILYLEGGTPDANLRRFFRDHAMATRQRVDRAWLRPAAVSVPATPDNLESLAVMGEHLAEPELCIHFHVYRGDRVLLSWHDAFTQPMLLSGDLPEAKVREFAQAVGMVPQAVVNMEPGDPLHNRGSSP